MPKNEIKPENRQKSSKMTNILRNNNEFDMVSLRKIESSPTSLFFRNSSSKVNKNMRINYKVL